MLVGQNAFIACFSSIQKCAVLCVGLTAETLAAPALVGGAGVGAQAGAHLVAAVVGGLGAGGGPTAVHAAAGLRIRGHDRGRDRTLLADTRLGRAPGLVDGRA